MFRRFSLAVLISTIAASTVFAQPAKPRKPNVILIITDDQGHGDLGFHGNPVIKTPNVDKFAKQSVRMKNFHVSPVCSPTRASLMTGRYNYRTGVVDTFQGRSMMHSDEVTIASILRALGYRTGIFGKWHLGDNYPLRAIDHGFTEALVLKGGGIGQPSDPPGGESYFNPVLQHNGKAVKKDGYISDVITDAALDFIAKKKGDPFFCYIAFNAPHTPLEVPKNYHDLYKDKIKLDAFPKFGFPIEGKVNLEDTAKIYGMITNIDDNIGRLLAKLDELKIAEDTIVIFLTDNGPQQPRYNSGMRGRKGTVFEGGTHVPFFVRWPAQLPKDRDVEQIAAHIDVAPTLASICGGKMPQDRAVDGKNLLPLWKGEKVDWADRSLFFQWHRGNVPEMYRACAVRSPKWRLVQPNGVAEKAKFDKTKFMLFDVENDPNEMKDIAEQHPQVVASLKRQYENWFNDVKSTRGFKPPVITVGSAKEPVTILTRQDMRDAEFWWVRPEKADKFDIQITLLKPADREATVHLEIAKKAYDGKIDANGKSVTLRNAALPDAALRIAPVVHDGQTPAVIRFVEIRKVQ
jgi:arylsulfatase A-like enzyme